MPSNYYRKNMERCREMARKRYHRRKKECPEAIMLEHARGRANRNGLDFNLELEDIVIPEKCPILDIPLKAGKGKISYCSPVLDRKDNEQGYVKGNVAVISNKANILKSNCSKTQIKNLFNYVFETEIKSRLEELKDEEAETYEAGNSINDSQVPF